VHCHGLQWAIQFFTAEITLTQLTEISTVKCSDHQLSVKITSFNPQDPNELSGTYRDVAKSINLNENFTLSGKIALAEYTNFKQLSLLFQFILLLLFVVESDGKKLP